MLDFTDWHRSVLERYSRPVVHMRRQVSEGRFGLVFGAGISGSFGVPTWAKLVERLAADPDVEGKEILQMVPPRAGLPYQTQMLFEHFKQRRYQNAALADHHKRPLDFRIGADWREIVRKHLYSSVPDDLGASLASHPYLRQYLPLIQSTQMTVTYNFDDFIEQSLLQSRENTEPTSRGFESVTNPWTQFRRATAVIYHANGVVPQNALETPSDRFVFSEASYAEELMGIFAGDQAGLVNHFSKHTCLLVGVSLEDETLRSMLMQGARSCPGNFHYYVHYVPSGQTLEAAKQRAIILTNFKVYNLVTLFLGDEEIRALGELINIHECSRDHFCDFAEQHGIPVQFKFYITGPLGVGKSTTVNQFRNLAVLDEWLHERPAILAKDWEQLDNAEREKADIWIVGQFKLKNDILRHGREGIFVMDRGPLDPLCFTPDAEWGVKAERLLKGLCPDQATWEVETGRVVLLQGDGEELGLRMVITQRKDYTGDKLEKMEEALGNAYGSVGVVRFDTRGLQPSDVARRVGEIIHLEDYEPVCNLHDRLQRFREARIDAAN